MKAEARRRVAMASAAYTRNKRILLQNCHVDLHARGSLFRGLVTSTFYNLEIWTPQMESWKVRQDGYCCLLRRLLVPNAAHDTIIRLSAAEVHFRTGQPPLDLLAKAKRLGLL